MISSALQEALVAFSLAAVVAVSPHPASEALNVPGEPRIVDGVILNCFRFTVSEEDEDTIPDITDSILAVNSLDWSDLVVEPDCHYINVHDVAGAWRLDASFHYVIGDNGDGPHTVGISGLLVSDTSRLRSEEIVLETLDKLTKLLLDAHSQPDEDWPGSPSFLFH